MGGIHIRVAYPQRGVRVLRHHCLRCKDETRHHTTAEPPATRPYGCTAITMVERPGAPPPRQEGGFNTVFIERMQANFCVAVKPSAGLGDALTSTLPGLGGGLQSL